LRGPAERLNRTDVSQPAIFVTSIACWRAILASNNAGNGEYPLTAAMGLSLGEYTALHIAGAISFRDALELVTLRGRAMQDAAEQSAGGMVALVGADEAQAQSVCDAARGSDVLVCANFNAPGQIVISGSRTACERAVVKAGEMGLRAQPLAVAGAFHSPLMAPAAERLRGGAGQDADPAAAVAGDRERDGPAARRGVRAGHRREHPAPARRAADQPGAVGAVVPVPAGASPGDGAPRAGAREDAVGLMRRIDKAARVTTHDEPG
jgi:malonyl CoA-acyl carrier protein transacylase